MYELTNEQRHCFALIPVASHWDKIEVRPGPYDQYKMYLYLEGDKIVKCIMCGEALYSEYELNEEASPDRRFLLPKTSKGKPVSLTSASVEKRTGTGMKLYYSDRHIQLLNEVTQRSYYMNGYLKDDVQDLDSFSRWVEDWCRETTDADTEDIRCFSEMTRRHVRYGEGDVFRFKIDRRQYGYGRILLNYDAMRKKKEPFWDILIGKPLICSVYHIVTERADVPVEELKSLKSLPSTIIADNALFYGEYEIIGNIPITADEDYPVMYGDSISFGEKAVCFQCGRVFRKLEGRSAMYPGFRNNGVAFDLNLTKDILLECIGKDSNGPYWEQYYPHLTERDLRAPRYADKLMRIMRQVGL